MLVIALHFAGHYKECWDAAYSRAASDDDPFIKADRFRHASDADALASAFGADWLEDDAIVFAQTEVFEIPFQPRQFIMAEFTFKHSVLESKPPVFQFAQHVFAQTRICDFGNYYHSHGVIAVFGVDDGKSISSMP